MKKPPVFRVKVLFSLLLAGFAVSAGCTGCFAGSYRQPAAFLFEGGESVLYGLSKEAAAGRLAFTKPASLRYVFEPPLAVPPDFSLEVGYTLSPPVGDRAANRHQVTVEAIPVSDAFGTGVWELPLNAAFLALPDRIAAFRYALPLAGPGTDAFSLGELRVSLVAQDGEREGTGTVLEISSLRLVPRWFGFVLDGDVLALTPFVFVMPEDPYPLVIDPPAAYRFSTAAGISLRDAAGEARISAGEKRFRFMPGPASSDLVIPPAIPGTAAYPASVYVPGAAGSGARLPGTAFTMEGAMIPASLNAPGTVRDPVPADPGLILIYPGESWRDKRYEVFQWPAFPQVLIFDTANYRVQERLFKRLAFFVEKRDYRGRLVPDWELADIHGWNAHDYRAEDLARFFEAARQENFPLLDEERELLDILRYNGIVIQTSTGAIQSGTGAVLSISRESPDYLRYRFMVHEGFHGIFFLDEEFREFSRDRWEKFDADAKQFFRSYLDSQRYDLADPYLTVNEFMAYCLQQPVSQAGRYFGETLPRQIDASPWRRAVLPPHEESPGGELSWPTLGRAFVREAEAFSAYVSRRWGLAAGRISSVSDVSAE
jgi:hypothetical protein